MRRSGEPLGQFFCSRCGAAFRPARRRPKRRWAWPAAFSAMTAVAAVLLVALVVRVEPRTAAAQRRTGRFARGDVVRRKAGRSGFLVGR